MPRFYFSKESGNIRYVQLLAIRYFAYFITKCVLARKIARKLSSFDLAFIVADLNRNRSYSLGALIAHHLTTNREKGGICGGLIASRLLALHGLEPHYSDFQFPIERLDIESMIQHGFVSLGANVRSLPYELSFPRQGRRKGRTEKIVYLHAPALFNFDNRQGWSLTEEEVDTYVVELSQQEENVEEDAEDNSVQPSNLGESSYQQPSFDWGTSSSSSQVPHYDCSYDDPPSWGYYPRY